MRKLACLVGTCSLAIVLLTLTGIVGCEDDDDDSSTGTGDLSVSPGSVTLDASVTNTVTFTAAGGASNYSWSVKDSSLGTLTAADDTAIYTSKTNQGNNYVTVTDDSNDVATATITQE
jgi:hypothetical protein